jgi:hypothetical protein
VHRIGGAIVRLLDRQGATDFDAVEHAAFFERGQAAGEIVATSRCDLPAGLDDRWIAALRHERVPVISYPYEWTFSMRRDAALLQLRLVREALADGIVCKDASAYNVQFIGPRPVFIDVGSFAPLDPERHPLPWPAYRQFCMLFLYPLLLEAHLGISPAPWLRGSIEGIDPEDVARILRGRARWRAGVLTHVHLQAAAARRYASRADPAASVAGPGDDGTAISLALVARLEKLIGGLDPVAARSVWSDYSGRGHYERAALAAKDRFVRDAVAQVAPEVVVDMGANDGRFALDADRAVVDRLYRRSRTSGDARILPLVADIADPSPGLGWNLAERSPLADRVGPDLVFSLALIHHVVIGRNVPIQAAVDHLAAQAPMAVLEVPHRDDPMVRRLLAAKDETVHEDYDLAAIESAVSERFSIERTEQLGPTRTIWLLARR